MQIILLILLNFFHIIECQLEFDLVNLDNMYGTTIRLGKNELKCQGNPAQPIRVSIDTGSSQLWVRSSQNSQLEHFGISNDYFCGKSCEQETYQDIQNVKYAIGIVDGILTRDQLVINNQTVNNFEFIQATKSKDLKILKSEGILGLGRIHSSSDDQTFISQLKKQFIIKKMVFALYLGKESCQNQSKLFIGKFPRGDNPYYNGKIQYVDLDGSLQFIIQGKDEWAVEIKSLNFDDENKKVYGVIDSGSSDIVLNEDLMKKILVFFKDQGCTIYKTWQNLQQLECSENDMTKYPNLKFKINNKTLTIFPSSYFKKCYLSYFGHKCSMRIISQQEISDGQMILGEPFFKQYFSVFDMEKNRFGYAPIRQNSNKSNLIDTQQISWIFLITGTFFYIFFMNKL